ncbi:MAG: hypothetical protein IJP29_01060 [Lachnospiraceae bacterium]|nr:hypothetical protein [Lachnospiraceae bacterium]
MGFNEFFDKVVETSSNAVDKAVDTTKRLANISDLKSKINNYNNEKNKLFTQIGMDIYIAKKQGESFDTAIDEFVSKIDTLNIKIEQVQEKIDLIKSNANN